MDLLRESRACRQCVTGKLATSPTSPRGSYEKLVPVEYGLLPAYIIERESTELCHMIGSEAAMKMYTCTSRIWGFPLPAPENVVPNDCLFSGRLAMTLRPAREYLQKETHYKQMSKIF